jgi:hypothetical protein
MFNPQPKQKKVKKPSRSALVKSLDAEFSIFIRNRFAVNDIATCFTCGKQDHWKKLQCGHFQSRKHYSTRWDETNCQVQCYACNVMKNGEQYKFGLFLNSLYGASTAFDLMQQAKVTLKIKDFELIEKIDYYKKMNVNIK